jgi:thioredoxin
LFLQLENQVPTDGKSHTRLPVLWQAEHGRRHPVDFYADWCGPCKVMAPMLDEIARKKAGKILVAKVDTDRSPQVSQRYGVRSIPYFARFENGQVVKSVVGAAREGLAELAG